MWQRRDLPISLLSTVSLTVHAPKSSPDWIGSLSVVSGYISERVLTSRKGIAEGLLWRVGFLQGWRRVVCAAQCCWGTGAAKCVVGKVVVA